MSPITSDLEHMIDGHWLDFECEASMLTFVSPNDVCPIAIPQAHAQVLPIQQQYHIQQSQQQAYSAEQLQIEDLRLTQQHQYHYDNLPEDDTKPQISFGNHIGAESSSDTNLKQQDQQYIVSELPQDSLAQLVTLQSSANQVIGPPPILVSRHEKRYSIQQQLDIRRALAHKKCAQLKARLDSEPLRYPPKIMKKSSGKKMTGRERLNELQRQERHLIEHQDYLRSTIYQLEAKCGKLKEILNNIVANSPEYNDEMIDCLKADGLLVDSHIN